MPPTWLSANDISTEGQWKLSDNSPLSYTNWNSGEPNDEGNEDCAGIKTDGTWNDIECDSTKAVVCEVDQWQ